MTDLNRTSLVEPCPECHEGKHGNCDGTSWDKLQDGPAPCPCAVRDHQPLEDDEDEECDHDWQLSGMSVEWGPMYYCPKCEGSCP